MNEVVGKRFGRLLVIECLRKEIGKRSSWVCKCRCNCGEFVVVAWHNLRSWNTRSCGCLHDELCRARKLKHGLSKTRTYRSWLDARRRCSDKRHSNYSYYGGRGIRMCKRWTDSFENFLEDMGSCPPGLTLERKDNNKDYVIGNCKWATKREQGRNQRSNVWLEANGKRMVLEDWVKELKVSDSYLRRRLVKLGMPFSDIVRELERTS